MVIDRNDTNPGYVDAERIGQQRRSHTRSTSGETVQSATSDRKRICDMCREELSGSQALSRHLREVHQRKDKVPCKFQGCHELFTRAESMRRHMKRFH